MHDISIVIGTGDAVTNDENDPFGGVITGINADLRESAAQNLLNFTLDGEVLGYNKSEDGTLAADATPNKKYTIDIGADINPFELLPLIDALVKNEDGSIGFNMSKEDMMTMVEKRGCHNNHHYRFCQWFQVDKHNEKYRLGGTGQRRQRRFRYVN